MGKAETASRDKKTFLALRIAVNRAMGGLGQFLFAAVLLGIVLVLSGSLPASAQSSYYTPETACREGFHKTDWFEPGYPYYIECASEGGAPAHYGRHGRVYLPDDSVSPGVIRTTDQNEICNPKFRTAPFRLTTQAMKNAVYREYGVQPNKGICVSKKKNTSGCEVDHRVPLELGGLDDIHNLWPQPSVPAPGYHEKDKLENWLKRRVCVDKKISLADAQKALMGDWYDAYVGAHLGPAKKSESAYPNDGGQVRAASSER
jgi:hypothetical protein